MDSALLGVPAEVEQVLPGAGGDGGAGGAAGQRAGAGGAGGVGRLGGEHPHVLGGSHDAAGRLRGRPDVAQRAAQDDVAAGAGDGEGPQRRRLRHEGVVLDGRGRGGLDGLLPDPGGGLPGDAGGQVGALVEGELPAEHGPLGVGRGSHDEPAEVGHDVRAHGPVPAPVGDGGGEGEILAAQRACQAGQVGEQGRVAQHAGAEGVDHGDGAGAGGLDEPGDAPSGAAPQLQGVDVGGVHAAQEDVDRFEAAQRARPHPSVLDDEVAALDERQAEHGREVAVVERGRARRAGGEHRDAGTVGAGRGGHLLEGRAQGLEVGADATGAGLAVDAREHLGDHAAVGHDVSQPDRGVGAVGEHGPRAVGVAREVRRGVEELVGAGDADAVGGADEAGVAQDHLRRQQPGGQQAALAVEVGEDRVEQLGALAQRRLQVVPLQLVDEHRQRVELPRVCGIGRDEALVLQQAHDLGAAGVEPVRPAQPGLLGELLPGQAGGAGRLEHLVVPGAVGAVGLEQVQGGSRCVAMSTSDAPGHRSNARQSDVRHVRRGLYRTFARMWWWKRDGSEP